MDEHPKGWLDMSNLARGLDRFMPELKDFPFHMGSHT